MERLIQWIYRAVFGIEVRFANRLEQLQCEIEQLTYEMQSIETEWHAKRAELDALLIAEEIDPAGAHDPYHQPVDEDHPLGAKAARAGIPALRAEAARISGAIATCSASRALLPDKDRGRARCAGQ